MKKHRLLLCLFVWLTFTQAVKAQTEKPIIGLKTIAMADVPRHVGKIVKVNFSSYTTADDGKTLFIYLKTSRPQTALTLLLTGAGRKEILEELPIRRKLNRQIKSPLDTSITAVGKIISDKGRLRMLVSQPANVYVDADAEIEQP